MDINDYLIDPSGKNWAELLADWVPSLPAEFTVWMVNRFCDIITILDDGSVHMLDVGVGQTHRLADNQDDFCRKIDEGNNADQWLMVSLVDACVASGMTLNDNQCYGYKLPPVLGGKYTLDNFEPIDLAVHLAFQADIHRQIKDLPDGTPVKRLNID